MKKYIAIFFLIMTMTSCYKENEVVPDVLVSNGKIANISVFWAGTTRLTTTVTVDATSQVPVTVEYISEVPVKEFRLYSRNGTTGTFVLLNTIPFASATVKYDERLRNNVVTFNVNAPTAKNATTQFASEVVTTNDLLSAQRTVTVRSKP
jgi:hypothetical protein